MKKEDWLKGIEAWKNVQRQAEIDMVQATIYIQAIEEEIARIDKEEKQEVN